MAESPTEAEPSELDLAIERALERTERAQRETQANHRALLGYDPNHGGVKPAVKKAARAERGWNAVAGGFYTLMFGVFLFAVPLIANNELIFSGVAAGIAVGLVGRGAERRAQRNRDVVIAYEKANKVQHRESVKAEGRALDALAMLLQERQGLGLDRKVLDRGSEFPEPRSSTYPDFGRELTNS